MEKNKLLRTLLALHSTELKSFREFLDSPYFNKREDVRVFYKILLPFIRKKKTIPKPEKCFKIIYGAPYDDQKFRLLKSYLFRLLKKFIIVEEVINDKLNNALYLAKGYRSRALLDDFEKALEHIIQRLEKAPYRNADYFAYYYQLLWEQHQTLYISKPTDGSLLKSTSQYIDYAYLALKLKHICLLAEHKNVYDSDFETGFLKEILDYVEQSDLLQMPTISTYYYGYLLLTHPDKDTYFQHFKNTLFENGHLFPPHEIRVLYLMAINHAVRKKNIGNKVYFPELKALYMEGLDKRYLFDENGHLSRFSYLNIITTGLRMQDYEWVENIIHTYKENLEANYRESSFNFNLARLEYSRRNYTEALSLLQQSHPQNILLNLAVKVLFLKIFYELEELEALNSHLDALRNFMRRKKIIGYHRRKHFTFISYVQKMIKLNPFNKKEKRKLLEVVRQEEDLMEKEWIIEQLKEVKS